MDAICRDAPWSVRFQMHHEPEGGRTVGYRPGSTRPGADICIAPAAERSEVPWVHNTPQKADARRPPMHSLDVADPS